MKNTDMIQQLPIIDIENSLFMNMDNDLSDEKIKSLIGKHIVFKLTDDATDFGLLGILEDYKNNQLIIRREGASLVFELYEIFGIEELTLIDNIDLSNEIINCVCELTNYKNESIVCLVTDVTNDDIEFKVKIKNENILTFYYPKELVKDISII